MSGTWIELGITSTHKDWANICEVPDPHVTLCYNGSHLTGLQAAQAATIVRRWYLDLDLTPTDTNLSGSDYEIFAGGTAVIKLNSSSAFLEERDDLVAMLQESGIPVNTDYPFVPHVTLNYKRHISPAWPQALAFNIADLSLKHNGSTYATFRLS